MQKELDEQYFWNLYKDKETFELEVMVYLSGDSYSDVALSTLKKLLDERLDRIIGITHKFCSVCKLLNVLGNKVCQCGYSFDAPNINEIKAVETKRKSKNRVFGIFMIIIGSIFLAINWPTDENRDSNKSIHKYTYGIPALMILIGIGTLFSGRISRKPTGTVFDSVLGAPNNLKSLDDHKPFFLCKSCGKPFFEELRYDKCPSCGETATKN